MSIGMKQTTWGGWERNPPEPLMLLARLAQRYNVSADYLLGLVDDPGGRRELAADEQQLLAIWRDLSADQRAFVLETVTKLQQWSQPRIIGSDND